MNWYDKLKPVLKGLKWGVIAAVIASGWIMAAWIKADLKPSLGQLGQQSPPVFLEPLKPGKGQEWAINPCVNVQYLAEADRQDSNAKKTSSPGKRSESKQTASEVYLSSDQATDSQLAGAPAGAVLPLGKFLAPSGGRDKLWVTPLLDSQTGKTTLRLEPAGGFARFGGERYAFIDASYQRALQSDFESLDVSMLAIGVHQDMGRIGKLELMAEGWIQSSFVNHPTGREVEIGVGAKLRVALPF